MSSYIMTDKTDTQEEIKVVGPGADEDDSAATPPEDTRAGADYDYPEGDDADSPGRHEAQDERTGHSEDDSDSESGLTRQQRKRRHQREKLRRDQRELEFLRSRNEQLERQRSQDLARIENRQTQSDMLAIDGRISQAENDVREAESLLTQALRNNDADSVTEALRVRDTLRDGLQQLRGAKQNTARAAQARETASAQPPAVDPAISARAGEWAREHAWFDPQARDEDSTIAYAVERRLFSEGRLDPRSDDYWDEVDRRLAKRLPEHYSAREDDDDKRDERDDRSRRNGNGRVNGNGADKRRPSGPTIKVGGRERTLRKGEVFIDEDRKQAMIEAGVWDDEKERARFLKAYQTYDRDAGRRPR